MQIHDIQRKTKLKRSVQVGRGGTRGKTSGRGTKGQNARAGHKKYPEIRDAIKRIPKLRGYSFGTFQTKTVVVNVIALETAFENGAVITPAILAEKKIVMIPKGMAVPVKILGDGELSKKLTITGCLVSATAKAKIEKAGGTVEK
ncbi:MAG: 50S ribosomal protein L15 [Candidatus Paceibacterota bacterium]|jgi:large subunit ribosomal protein L15